jgi:hypothetical protein
MGYRVEHDMEKYFALVQDDQPLRSDRRANRVINVKLKYEGISGNYTAKFYLNENDFFTR